jgi:hypothetical protein
MSSEKDISFEADMRTMSAVADMTCDPEASETDKPNGITWAPGRREGRRAFPFCRSHGRYAHYIPRREPCSGRPFVDTGAARQPGRYLTWILTRRAATNSSHVDGLFPNDSVAT